LIVYATTSLVGPAAFQINDTQTNATALIAVVGFDSARPRTLALKSIAGIACPTVMLTRLISRDDLETYVRFHESAHALQFVRGMRKEAQHESHYERCRVEAEADVFASLWWLKTRHGDAVVPTFVSHLRRSSYFEHAVRGNERISIQYAIHQPLIAALELGEQMARDGTLSTMS
jgi:hypothetical protein